MLFGLLVAPLGACDDGSAASGADAGLPPGVVEYRLQFSYGAATPHPDGGWQVETDRGQIAHVQEGWLASWSTQLVPCTTESALDLLVGRAWAGHGELDDPSTANLQLREALHGPTEHVARVEYTAEAARYCKAHYLSAQLTLDTPAIHLRGVVTVDGVTQPFEVQTDFATGTLGAFEAPYDPAAGGIVIVVDRALGGLLDGMDLRDPDPAQLVFNLVDATRLSVR